MGMLSDEAGWVLVGVVLDRLADRAIGPKGPGLRVETGVACERRTFFGDGQRAFSLEFDRSARPGCRPVDRNSRWARDANGRRAVGRWLPDVEYGGSATAKLVAGDRG
jgi:hypothetical protein